MLRTVRVTTKEGAQSGKYRSITPIWLIWCNAVTNEMPPKRTRGPDLGRYAHAV